MTLSFDKFERYEVPQVTLCNPNSRAIEIDGKITITDTVGVLSNPKGMNLKLNFNAPHELSFDYYRHKGADPIGMPTEYIVEILNQSNQFIKQVDTFLSYEEAEKCVDEFELSTLKNGEHLNIIKQSFYDSIYEAIQTDRYIFLTDIGYFVISSVTDSDKDNIDKKSISLKSCEENEFATAEGLYLEEGTYYLHTEDNKGLIDLFLPKTAGWTIGFIDPSLLAKPYFVEKTEVDNGYNFLYTTIQDMFECIVEPDIVRRTVSFYSRKYYVEHHLTDIHIAKYNLLKHKTVEENDEDKYTALNVQGKDENLEIRAVNPTGKNTIYNFEVRYPWMSSALQRAVEKWQKKCESVEEKYLELQTDYYNYMQNTVFPLEQDVNNLELVLKEQQETRDLIVSGEYNEDAYKTQDDALKAVNKTISDTQSQLKTKKTSLKTANKKLQSQYAEQIAKINSDCALSMSIENFDMESGTLSLDGVPSDNNKRIRTANYIILEAGTYIISNTQNYQVVLRVFDSSNNHLKDLSSTAWSTSPLTFTIDSQYKIKFVIRKPDDSNIAISDVSGIKITKKDMSFAVDVNGNAIFTEDLLNELMTHIKSTDYIDEYMVVTESMTYPERFEKAKELMGRAQSQLVKISSGQKTYSIDTRSFLFDKQFRHFSEQLCAGAIIYVETKKDMMEQLHLTGIDIEFDEKTTGFTLGNKYDRSDLKALYEDTLGQNSKSFNELKYIASIVEDQKKYYKRDWAAELRTLTLNNVLTSEDQSFEINNRGIIGRKRQLDEDGAWATDENDNPLFYPEQLKLINETLVFTEDNWNSASTAVGKIAVGYNSDGSVKYAYGINGQVLIGELILGNNLLLTGTGAGIKIKDNNNNDVFYADENGNLNLKGIITAQGGLIAGFNIGKDGWYNTNALYKRTDNGDKKYEVGMKATNGDNDAAFYVRKTTDNWANSELTFYISNSGKLVATNAEISGGACAGWSITSSEFKTGDSAKNAFHISSSSSSASNWIKAYDNNGDVTFRVSKTGILYAKGAVIDGEVNAISGSIAGFNIGDGGYYTNALYKRVTDADNTSIKYEVGMKASSGAGNAAFYVRKTTDNWANSELTFYVNHRGKLVATDAEIKGTITADSVIQNGVKIGNNSNSWFQDITNGNGTAWYGTYGTYQLSYFTKDNENWGLCKLQASSSTSATIPFLELVGTGYVQTNATWKETTASSSDKNLKNTITSIDKRYTNLFDNLRPVTYKYNHGTSDRLHTGFIAQEVAESLQIANIDSKDFAGLVIVDRDTNNEHWALRYEEFIALNTWQIQKLKSKVAELENIIIQLKTQI